MCYETAIAATVICAAHLLHVMGDLLRSVGAIAAAINIMPTGWTFVDPVLPVGRAVLCYAGGLVPVASTPGSRRGRYP